MKNIQQELLDFEKESKEIIELINNTDTMELFFTDNTKLQKMENFSKKMFQLFNININNPKSLEDFLKLPNLINEYKNKPIKKNLTYKEAKQELEIYKSLTANFYNFSGVQNNIEQLENNLENLRKMEDLLNEQGSIFIEISKYFDEIEPFYFYNKKIKEDFFNLLKSKDIEETEKIFIENFNLLKLATRSLINIKNTYLESKSINNPTELQVKQLYIPLIAQLYEDVLTQILTPINFLFGTDKKDGRTLGQLKNSFNKANKRVFEDIFIYINVDLRNAISHGKIEYIGNGQIELIPTKEKDKLNCKENPENCKIKLSQIIQLIDDLFDLSSGLLKGLFEFFIVEKLFTPTLLHYNQEKLSDKFKINFLEFRIFSENTSLDYINITESMPELNSFSSIEMKVNFKNLENKKHIFLKTIDLFLNLYFAFKNYEQYNISYDCKFSAGGLFHLKNFQVKELIKAKMEQNIEKIFSIFQDNENALVLISEIEDKDFYNEKLFKYQIFKNLKGNYWKTENIKDISIEKYKRLEATLIIDELKDKKQLKNLFIHVVDYVKYIKTLKNPKDNKAKFGASPADYINLRVELKSKERKEFKLPADDEYFICFVHFYSSEKVPKQITKYLLENLKPEKFKKSKTEIIIFWNPKIFKV